MLEDKEVRGWMDSRESEQRQFLADQAQLNRRHQARVAWLLLASALIAGVSALAAIASLVLVVMSDFRQAFVTRPTITSVKPVQVPDVVSPVPDAPPTVVVPVQSTLPDGTTTTKYVRMNVGAAPTVAPEVSSRPPTESNEPVGPDATKKQGWGDGGSPLPEAARPVPVPAHAPQVFSPSEQESR